MEHKAAEDISAEDWAGEMGEKWLAHLDQFEGMIEPAGEALLAAAGVAPGDAVLDLGCGGGVTTIAIAKTAGPEGRATGLDISPVLATHSAKRAAAAGVQNVDFITGDATVATLDQGAYDILFSRFGNMFFEDPVAAFKNLHSALKPGGRAIFSCWAPPEDNQWLLEVMEVVTRYIEMGPPEPRAPGPFAFAETAYVSEVLTKAGFSNVKVEAWRGKQMVGGKSATAAEAADFVVNALSVGDALKELPPEKFAAVIKDITEAFARHETPEGVEMSATAWFVNAKA